MTSKRQKVIDAILTELEHPRYVMFGERDPYVRVEPIPRAIDPIGPAELTAATIDDGYKYLRFLNTGPDVIKTARFACNSLNAEEIAKAIERLRGGRSL
jgi:hypothetical protein